MIRRLLRKWADAALQKQVAKLESELDTTERKLAVSIAEIESMAAVISRDRARIKSEAAAYSRAQAEAEGNTNEQRDYPSIERRLA